MTIADPRRNIAEAVSAILQLDGSQKEVFRALTRATEALDVQELAEEVGLHPNSVRDALAVMVEEDLVASTPEQTRQRGRPRLLYEAVVKTDPTALAAELMNFSAAVADQLPNFCDDSVSVARSIGGSWGERIITRMGIPDHSSLRPIDVEDEDELDFHLSKLALLMSNMGFEARLGESVGEMRIYSCPLLTGEVEGSALVCQIHQGMMSKLVGRLSQGRLDAELEPSATPTHCLVNILRTDQKVGEPPAQE